MLAILMLAYVIDGCLLVLKFANTVAIYTTIKAITYVVIAPAIASFVELLCETMSNNLSVSP